MGKSSIQTSFTKSENSHQNCRCESGFTLAEILITLGIIGIVAAITIPTLMKNVQDWQFKQAWKKQFSILSQAYSQIITDNGGSIKGAFPHGADDTNQILLLFKDKMKTVKYCSQVLTEPDCWLPFSGMGKDDLVPRDKTGATEGFYGPVNPGMILADGTLIYAFDGNIEGSNKGDFYSYIRLAVDVNGYKKPNVIGRDIFAMYFTDNKIIPYGLIYFKDSCENVGYSCAYEYLYK